jgi:hypothetical protein
VESLALFVEHEGEFHIDTEVSDRAVISKLDLVLGNPRTADSFDRLLGFSDAFSDGILEGSGGSRCDLDHLRN